MVENVYLIRYSKKGLGYCKRYYATAKTEEIADKIIKEAEVKYPIKLFWKRICKVITE